MQINISFFYGFLVQSFIFEIKATMLSVEYGHTDGQRNERIGRTVLKLTVTDTQT